MDLSPDKHHESPTEFIYLTGGRKHPIKSAKSEPPTPPQKPKSRVAERLKALPRRVIQFFVHTIAVVAFIEFFANIAQIGSYTGQVLDNKPQQMIDLLQSQISELRNQTKTQQERDTILQRAIDAMNQKASHEEIHSYWIKLPPCKR